jgi:mercuric ion transport protein
MKPDEQVMKENGRLAVILGFFASVLSVGCCFIPVILVSLGLGGAAASRVSFLDSYRPYLTALSLVSFGWGFYRYWQRIQKSSCNPLSRNRFSFSTSPTVFWVLVAGALFFLAFPWMDGAFFHHSFLDPDRD